MVESRKFTVDWTFRTGERTIDFVKGGTPIDAETLAAAESAGVLTPEEDKENGDNGTSTGSAPSRAVNLKG